MLAVLALLYSLVAHANAELRDELYHPLKQAAHTVRADGSRYILGIGRSPSGIISYLSKRHPGSVSQIALTGFRHLPQGGDDEQYRALTSEEETALFKYFDAVYPSDEVLKGREVSLVDYSQRGDTIFSLHFYLKRYLEKRNRDVKHELVVMTRDAHVLKVRETAAKHKVPIRLINLPESDLVLGLENQWFETTAPYGPYRVRDMVAGRAPPTWNNSEFESLLVASMAEDDGSPVTLVPERPDPKPCPGWLRVLRRFF